MVEKFREKIKKNGQKFSWFHKKYIGDNPSYAYFIIQLNNPETMSDKVTRAIQKYLRDSQ